MDNRIGLPHALLLMIAGAQVASHKTEGGSNYARGIRGGAPHKPVDSVRHGWPSGWIVPWTGVAGSTVMAVPLVVTFR